ncbi:hypothetical protein WJX72_000799 [[Myrmecia] bisecta]|uniref:Serine aminopeptidase S33 domain-containing protein n=1 Tax=[Myrmecia] bisecta TaxID=41462 RepID=A0AAW1QP26_9CHLO
MAGELLSAGGLEWAFRTAEVNQKNAKTEKLPVLLLHGLGSSSYSYRGLLDQLGEAGHEAYAVDWIGHGASEKPNTGKFDYSEGAYLTALATLVEQLPIRKPFALVVQGFVLGQYGLLYALQHSEQIEKLIILNTPVGLKTKLRPELAAYKSPLAFLRPNPKKPFPGMNYNASGSAYVMQYRDAEIYDRPYQESEHASVAIASIMDQVDFPALLQRVDEGYNTWRKPALLVFGSDDPFIDIRTAFDFLDSKRTNMRLAQLQAKLGHMPQEDYPEGIAPAMLEFLQAQA